MNPVNEIRFNKSTQPTRPPQGQCELKVDPSTGLLAQLNADGSFDPLGGGSVTTDQVLDAIGEDPAASREALQSGATAFINRASLLPFKRDTLAFKNAAPATSTYLTCWAMGDSIGTGNGPVPYIQDALMDRYGIGGLVSGYLWTAAGGASRLDETFGSGAAMYPADYDTSADFTYWLNGRYVKVPASGTVTGIPSDNSIRVGWKRVIFFYGIRNGGGTLTVNLKLDGATISSGTKNANTSTGTPGEIGTIEFSASDGGFVNHGALQYIVTGSVAESHYLGCVVLLENGGVVPFCAGCGSHTFVEQDTTPEANWTKFLTKLGCSLTVTGSKGETLAGLTEHVRKQTALLQTSTHILLGNTSGQSTPNTTENGWYRQMAYDNPTVGYINGEEISGSLTWLTQNSLNGDNIHLSVTFNRGYAETVVDIVDPSTSSAQSGDRSRNRLMTFGEFALRFQVNDTKIIVPLTSDASDSTAGTGWTISKSQGIHSLSWTTGASGDTTEAIRTREFFRISGDDTWTSGFTLLENFSGVTNVSARIGYGYNGVAPVTIDGAGVFWELGFDSSVLPWIRFTIHDGSNPFVTDKHYLPVDGVGGGSGYRTGATDPNHFVIRYDGGTNGVKRLRCWHCPHKLSTSGEKVTKPILVCDTTLTLTNLLGFFPATGQPNIHFAGVIRTSSPASNGSCRMLDFWYDRNPDDYTGFRNR